MKPLVMTLQAFGPYAGRNVVDFRPAIESGLFGIYGATGSGKSSIFSAMTFALFGEAAKSEQHATTLRSDHADPGITTEVELIFEIGGRRYRIVRRPEQTRPARRGSGETKETHKAALFDVTGLDLDTLSTSHPGKVLAEGRLKTVDEAIERVLGYGAAQFRQIVLLPQGKFETFLTADTKDRLSILRDLFDVSVFRRLTEAVKEKAKAAEETIRSSRAVCQGRLEAEAFASLDALGSGITEAKARHATRTEEARQAKAEVDGAEEAHQRATHTDEAFRAHAEAGTEVKRLEGERPMMDAVAARLTGARIAQLLADVDSAVGTARIEAEKAAGKLDKDREALARAGEAQQRVAQALQALRDEHAEAEMWHTELRELHRHAQTLAAAGPMQAAAAEAEAVTAAAVEASQRLKTRCDQLTGQYLSAHRKLEAARASELQRATLSQQISEVRHAFTAAEAHEKAAAQLAAARTELARLQKESETAVQRLAAAQAAHQAAETALLDNHAMVIAGRLADGAPCPVCGSQLHPAPARGSPDAEAHSERSRRAKMEYEAAALAAREAAGRLDVAEQRHRDREEALESLQPPEKPAREIATVLAAKAADLAALGTPVGLDALAASCQALEQAVAETRTAFEASRDEAARRQTALAVARHSRDDALRTVPSDLRAPEKLEPRRAELARKIDAYDATLKQLQEANQKAREAVVAAERDRENAEANKREADARLHAANVKMTARLAAHALTTEAYLARRADIPHIDALTAQVDAWRQQCSVAADRLREASERIAGVERPDTAALKVARDRAAVALQAATESAMAAAHRTRQLEALQANLATEIARLDVLEAESGPLRTLADAFAGKSGPRVDLETFAIATMFDRVLEAANLRLGPMTRGRYSLVRDTQGGGNARQGLGIAVDDAHTGRQRSTTTLSGGETFIAALALALGLSEIVESERGSVRLDTIFIDEGFGSLDAENDAGTLEQVLQTLQDLVGRSRAVGLISHVPLVQQTIPNGFLVTANPGGSHIEARP